MVLRRYYFAETSDILLIIEKGWYLFLIACWMNSNNRAGLLPSLSQTSLSRRSSQSEGGQVRVKAQSVATACSVGAAVRRQGTNGSVRTAKIELNQLIFYAHILFQFLLECCEATCASVNNPVISCRLPSNSLLLIKINLDFQ